MIMITNDILDGLMSKSGRKSNTERGNAKSVTVEQAQSIFETRRPFGKFYFCQHGKYIGIDNGDGDALSDVFDTLDDCLEWLER